MKFKGLMILGGVTLVVMIAAAFFAIEREDAIPGRGQLVFPDLRPRINDVREVVVAINAHTTSITHAGDIWTVKEKFGYRAGMDRVRRTILGLAELTIVEPKTKNPERYGKLGLMGLGAEGSTSTLISLKDADGNALAELIVGNRRIAKGDSSRDELYIRKPEDPQTWLAIGQLDVETSPDEWIDKQIFNIEDRRIREVRIIHPRGEVVTLRKDTQEDADFKVVPLPANAKITSPFTVNNVADTIAHLTFDDVQPATEAKLPSRGGVRAILETFDGLRVNVRIITRGGKTYATASAEFDQALVQTVAEEAPSEGAEDDGKTGQEVREEDEGQTQSAALEKPIEAVQREAEVLNEQLTGWVYIIPKFRADSIAKHQRDLISSDT
jgi:hypothetical protein